MKRNPHFFLLSAQLPFVPFRLACGHNLFYYLSSSEGPNPHWIMMTSIWNSSHFILHWYSKFVVPYGIHPYSTGWETVEGQEGRKKSEIRGPGGQINELSSEKHSFLSILPAISSSRSKILERLCNLTRCPSSALNLALLIAFEGRSNDNTNNWH